MSSVGRQIPRWGRYAEGPGVLALWQRHAAGEIEYTAEDHGLVVALTPIEQRQTRLAGSTGPRHLAPAGSINVIPKGADHWGCWGRDKESAYFALGQDRLRNVAIEHFDRDEVELFAENRPRTDPVLLHFSCLLREELRTGGLLSELYVDSLGSLIMVHMLRHYSNIGTIGIVGRPRRGGLTPRAREAVLAYMADRCAEPLTIAELAAIARLAPSTFIRAFREETGISPHKHLLKLRVERAEELMRTSDLPLAEVALATGFSSQSHLTTVFGRTTGYSPAVWRRERKPS